MADPNIEPEGGRRRRSRRIHERSRVALLDVFRESFRARDQFEPTAGHLGQSSDDNTVYNSNPSMARRVGVDEDMLRQHVRQHMLVLMNTIRLDSTVSLEDFPHVKKSVLNYGFQDLSDLSRKEIQSTALSRSLKQSLMDHEPRLVRKDPRGRDAISVSVEDMNDDFLKRLALHVKADLIADPADIPVDYEAEIDQGSGKMTLTKSK